MKLILFDIDFCIFCNHNIRNQNLVKEEEKYQFALETCNVIEND